MENLTKENVYVKVESKEQAEMYKAVLKSLKQPMCNSFYIDAESIRSNQDALIYSLQNWTCGNKGNLNEITFGQLIDIITKPEKIAVRVENEKEFNALLKHYNENGFIFKEDESPKWTQWTGKPLLVQYKNVCETLYESFLHTDEDFKEYKIIPFSDFAKEHNIRLPIITTVDGVDLFDGDYYHAAILEDDGRWYLKFYKNIYSGHLAITRPNTVKAFSTQEAAEKWIEEQNTVECASCEREKQKSEMDSEYPNVCKRCKDEEKSISIAIIWNSILDEVNRAESKHPNWPNDKLYGAS